MDKLNSIELFAGAGGLALGLEKAGFHNVLLNEWDKDACKTLRFNRPSWNVLHQDIRELHLHPWEGKVALMTGGFPCQAFSHSGKRLGLQDTRGTLFYEFARCIDTVQPAMFLAENVKGLITHDGGKTLATIMAAFEEIGYHVYEPLLLNANHYDVAQRRERLFIAGVQKQFSHCIEFKPPEPSGRPTLRDIFYCGNYYPCDVQDIATKTVSYSSHKRELFALIGQGQNWKALPVEMQKSYLGKMFESSGGKTGILKRLSYDEPSVTLLTCASQKQTERCHPTENRPLTIRESARIQSFPDEWIFQGSISSQYRQIGNAVPVLLGYHLGKMLHRQLAGLLPENSQRQ